MLDSTIVPESKGVSLREAPTLVPTAEPHWTTSPAPFRPLLKSTYGLHYGHVRTAIVQVVPDDHWPNMWRIIWPDGQVSDMANLSRSKDAAVAISERGPPARNRRRFHWKVRPHNIATDAA